MSTLYYLAYGSNLHPHRLKVRIPSSRFLGIVSLPGYSIAFHKRGACGSGKCNLLTSSDSTARAFAAIYEMAQSEIPLLDSFEGAGYVAQPLTVTLNGKQLTSFAYIAEDTHIDDSLKPYHWYKELVWLGARHHGLPNSYLDNIKAIESIDDPDGQRNATHQALLREIRDY